MNQLPKLSIICLSWNHEKYIEQAINSVVNQTYENIEIVYLDNNSTDNSFELAKNILEKSQVKYKIKKFEKNIGAVKAVNYAIKNLCDGTFISMIAMDDWLELDNYELKINYSLLHPEFGMIYSEGYYYYEDKKEIKHIPKSNLKEGWIFDELLKSNFLFMMGTLIKKEVYDVIGLYDEENSIEDWEFSLRVSQKYPIGLLPKPLFYYRQHSENYSKGNKKYYQDCLKVINKYKKHNNYKIGFNWINRAYTQLIYNEPFSIENLIYLVKNTKLNINSCKKILRYILQQ